MDFISCVECIYHRLLFCYVCDDLPQRRDAVQSACCAVHCRFNIRALYALWNAFFPLNVIIYFPAIFIGGYMLRTIMRFLSQTLDKRMPNYDLKSLFV